MAPAMLRALPDAPLWVVADRGHPSDAIRTQVWDMSARPAIPAKRNQAAQRCPDFIDVHRTQVERLWGRLKECRAVATRYNKTATSFMGALCLAAARDWLKPSIKRQNLSSQYPSGIILCAGRAAAA